MNEWHGSIPTWLKKVCFISKFPWIPSFVPDFYLPLACLQHVTSVAPGCLCKQFVINTSAPNTLYNTGVTLHHQPGINDKQTTKSPSEARGQPELLLILTSRGWSHVNHVISIFGSESWYFGDLIRHRICRIALIKCSINWQGSDQPSYNIKEGMLLMTDRGTLMKTNKRIAVHY